MSAFGVYAWGSAKLNALGRETKEMLVEPVCHEFGMTFESSPLDPADIMTFRNLKLVPHWDRAKYEDRLTGQRQNAPFEFFEAHLEEKHETSSRNGRRTEWVTVFRGQCLVARFPKPFKGVTRVERDHGAMNFLAKLGQDLPRVKLEDPVFEKSFEVYGTDQVEARFILTPDFMERLLSLEKAFQGKKLRCAFSGGEMYLCVEGKNLFEPGSMYRRMDDLSRVREMLTDFAAVFLLIDSDGRTPYARSAAHLTGSQAHATRKEPRGGPRGSRVFSGERMMLCCGASRRAIAGNTARKRSFKAIPWQLFATHNAGSVANAG